MARELAELPILDDTGLTASWLTGALRAGARLGTAATVTGVRATKVGTGQMGACYALELDYDEDASGAPQRLVAKLASPDAGARAFAASLNAYAKEVRFYRDIASSIATRVPHCYHASVADDGQTFVLLLEDLSPATARDQLEGCSPAQAELALEQAARLHGSSWEHRELVATEWLRGGMGGWRRFAAGAERIQDGLRALYGSDLEEEFLAVGDRLAAGGTARWVQRIDVPVCLWHCDYRLDNILFDAHDGSVPIAVLDWQSVMLARGTVDASYFVGAGLTVEDRREHDEALMRHYHAALLEHGASRYGWDACWEDYRANAVAGFLVAAISCVSVERTKRGDAMFLTMLRRHGQQILDHDALSLLDA